jgi:hypothetical protein
MPIQLTPISLILFGSQPGGRHGLGRLRRTTPHVSSDRPPHVATATRFWRTATWPSRPVEPHRDPARAQPTQRPTAHVAYLWTPSNFSSCGLQARSDSADPAKPSWWRPYSCRATSPPPARNRPNLKTTARRRPRDVGSCRPSGAPGNLWGSTHAVARRPALRIDATNTP